MLCRHVCNSQEQDYLYHYANLGHLIIIKIITDSTCWVPNVGLASLVKKGFMYSFLSSFLGQSTGTQFSSVQDGMYMLGKTHIRSTPSLNCFPSFHLKQFMETQFL